MSKAFGVVGEMIEKGYQPIDRSKGFTEAELQAYRNGLALYPTRSHPPMVFGYDMLPASQLPQWAHRDTLESCVVERKRKLPGGMTETQQVTLYKVLTNPPAHVIRLHAQKAKEAAARVEYVSASPGIAAPEPEQHWSDVERATKEER